MGSLKTAVGMPSERLLPWQEHGGKGGAGTHALWEAGLPFPPTAPQQQHLSHVARPAWLKNTFWNNTFDGNCHTLQTSHVDLPSPKPSPQVPAQGNRFLPSTHTPSTTSASRTPSPHRPACSSHLRPVHPAALSHW